MTFYAYDFDVRHVLSPRVAWGRVLRGGRMYISRVFSEQYGLLLGGDTVQASLELLGET